MSRPRRADYLRDDDDEAPCAEGRCRGCGALVEDQDEQPPRPCMHCGYPEHSAAFIDYDGCC